MSFFLNFTRGGQSQFLDIHLFLQTLKRFILIAFFLFVSSTSLLWWKQTSAHEWHYLKEWGKAKLISGPWAHHQHIIFSSSEGKRYRLSPQQVLSLPVVAQQPQCAKQRLWGAASQASLISSGISLLIAAWLTYVGYRRAQQQHLRGAAFVSPRQFKQALSQAKQISPWQLGGVPLPQEAETQHILLCGAPGSGKSVATHELLAQVRRADQKAVVYDIKGAFIPYYYREGKDILLNPLDDRCVTWNLWQECENETDYDAFAAALIPDGVGSDSFWMKAARTLLAISAAQFQYRPAPTLSALMQHLFCSDLNQVEELLVGTLGQAMVGKDLEKGTRSILLTLATYCKSLQYVKEEPSTPPFRIREWIAKDDDSWLFISSNQRMSETLKPLISLWLETAVNTLLSLTEDRQRRRWFFFDELASLHRLPSLEPVLARGRGYGACFVGAIQDINQLRDLYGHKAAETLASLFGTSVFFTANNHESTKWAAEQLGRAEFLETREGYSMGSHLMRDGVSLNQQRRQELIIMDAQIRHLKKREAYMVTAGGWPVTKLSFPLQTHKEICLPFIPRTISQASLSQITAKVAHDETNITLPINKEQKKLPVAKNVIQEVEAKKLF